MKVRAIQRMPASLRMDNDSKVPQLPRMRKLISSLLLGLAVTAGAQGPRFQVSFAKSANAGPITGRVYVALSRTSMPTSTPINQAGETGVPLFGVNVEALAAGKPV